MSLQIRVAVAGHGLFQEFFGVVHFATGSAEQFLAVFLGRPFPSRGASWLLKVALASVKLASRATVLSCTV